jgi:hypothetical protein
MPLVALGVLLGGQPRFNRSHAHKEVVKLDREPGRVRVVEVLEPQSRKFVRQALGIEEIIETRCIVEAIG